MSVGKEGTAGFTPVPIPNAVRAASERSFEIISLGEIPRQASPIPFIWNGILAHGCATLLSSIWKAGKTTLVCDLLRTMKRGGPFLGRDVAKGNALLLTEEDLQNHWIRRADTYDLHDHVHVLVKPKQPDRSFCGPLNWDAFDRLIVELIRVVPKYDLIVFDTWPRFSPADDENANREVQLVTGCLDQLKETGIGLLLVGHQRKSGGPGGVGWRGAGAMPAWADVILDFERFSEKNMSDRRRKLSIAGRFEDPTQFVIEQREYGYRLASGDWRTILRSLLDFESWRDTKQIQAEWKQRDSGAKDRTIQSYIKKAHEEGIVERQGEQNSGYEYRLRAT